MSFGGFPPEVRSFLCNGTPLPQGPASRFLTPSFRTQLLGTVPAATLAQICADAAAATPQAPRPQQAWVPAFHTMSALAKSLCFPVAGGLACIAVA